MIKRITTLEQRKQIQEQSKFKNKNTNNLTDRELKELVIIIAKKLKIIK